MKLKNTLLEGQANHRNLVFNRSEMEKMNYSDLSSEQLYGLMFLLPRAINDMKNKNSDSFYNAAFHSIGVLREYFRRFPEEEHNENLCHRFDSAQPMKNDIKETDSNITFPDYSFSELICGMAQVAWEYARRPVNLKKIGFMDAIDIVPSRLERNMNKREIDRMHGIQKGMESIVLPEEGKTALETAMEILANPKEHAEKEKKMDKTAKKRQFERYVNGEGQHLGITEAERKEKEYKQIEEARNRRNLESIRRTY